jgi:prepilin signal peptidase PulO-like enzyme (type II secretory pathway)
MVAEGIMFIFLLFLIGAVYSIIFSFFVLARNFDKFKIGFKKNRKILLIAYLIVIILIIIMKSVIFVNEIFYFLIVLLLIFPLFYVYLLSLDKCMIQFVKPNQLQEGDWLNEEVKLERGKVIRKSVHGLSMDDIALLRKARKGVWIKEGVVFVPVFLISFVIYLWILNKQGGLLDYLVRFLV